MRDVIVTCAINGGDPLAHKHHPKFPITPEQIVEEVAAAAKCGAAIVHIHARDPVSGAPTNDIGIFAEILERIRASKIAVLVNLSCSMDGLLYLQNDNPRCVDHKSTLSPVRQRLGHIAALRPDIGTIDCGTFAIDDAIFVARRSDLREMARVFQETEVKPEIECFDLGHVENARRLVAEGLVAPPPFLQVCMGTGYGGAFPTSEALAAMVARMPEQAIWAGFEAGPRYTTTLRSVVDMGGHVRVGLEDTLTLSNGKFAKNSSLVERAAEIIRESGNRVADLRATSRLLAIET